MAYLFGRAPSAGLVEAAREAATMAEDDPRRTTASVAMFERLADHWSLRAAERTTLLGGVTKSTWSEWRAHPQGARIKADARERIANLYTIDLHLHAFFGPEFADGWIRSPNEGLGGASPMAIMLRGRVEDVIAIRSHLERVLSSSGDDEPAYEAPLAVSYLPGDAAGAPEQSSIDDLRAIIERCERLERREPDRYLSALTSSLVALAAALADAGDPHVHDALIRAVEAQHRLLLTRSADGDALDRDVERLIALQLRFGTRADAVRTYRLYRDVTLRELAADQAVLDRLEATARDADATPKNA